jgi:hypothetical protein
MHTKPRPSGAIVPAPRASHHRPPPGRSVPGDDRAPATDMPLGDATARTRSTAASLGHRLNRHDQGIPRLWEASSHQADTSPHGAPPSGGSSNEPNIANPTRWSATSPSKRRAVALSIWATLGQTKWIPSTPSDEPTVSSSAAIRTLGLTVVMTCRTGTICCDDMQNWTIGVIFAKTSPTSIKAPIRRSARLYNGMTQASSTIIVAIKSRWNMPSYA